MIKRSVLQDFRQKKKATSWVQRLRSLREGEGESNGTGAMFPSMKASDRKGVMNG